MTALDKYERLEAEALWRQGPDKQHRDVIVSVGDSTLVISDIQGRPLTHWSLAAIARSNPGKFPAIYHPDGDAGERLEFAESEQNVVSDIEKLRLVIDKRRPKPGRLRLMIFAFIFVTLASLGVFWLPQAVQNYALQIIPPVKQQEIGLKILSLISEFTGKPCDAAMANNSLALLADITLQGQGSLYILPDGLSQTAHLPGNIILIGRELVEDYEEPDVAAGFILMEHLRSEKGNIFRDLLQYSGTLATFQFLTTGTLKEETLQRYSQHILLQPKLTIETPLVIARFQELKLRMSPYAFALDMTGEQTLALVEADNLATWTFEPSLTDADWVRLQNICGG